MSISEPSPPERGLTRADRGRDVGAAQAEVKSETSTGRRFLLAMSPRVVISEAEGHPVVIKQFLQFCLILIYPAWVFGVLAMAAIYYTVYPLLSALFWPVRAWMKANRPEDYAASQLK